jgi:predicted flap endonuclease-1-like 5' DNA nuclease
MLQMIEANWIVFVIALLIGLIVAWWIFARGTAGASRERKPDALDEGAAPARRNQALIDAPPAADFGPSPVTGTMAGIGEVIAVAAHDEVEHAIVSRAEQEMREKMEASEAAAAEPVPQPATSDDLTRIKGLGPKLATLLNTLGVTSFGQIAAWDEPEIDRIDTQLGAFKGRIRRDNWVEQARLLQSGDTAAYEAKFGKL